MGNGTKTDLSLSAALWCVFDDCPQTTFSTLDGANSVSFDAEIGDSWLALTAGVTTLLDDGRRFFADLRAVSAAWTTASKRLRAGWG